MTLEEAIKARHSVRAYKAQPLAEDIVKVLEKEIEAQNRQGHLHIQLIKNEPKAFQGKLAKYGKFSNVTNYLVMAGQKAEDLDERIGYYGEHLVLFENIPAKDSKSAQVIAKRSFSLIGFTQMDLGIAKYHFEVGAGKDNFEWA